MRLCTDKLNFTSGLAYHGNEQVLLCKISTACAF